MCEWEWQMIVILQEYEETRPQTKQQMEKQTENIIEIGYGDSTAGQINEAYQ